MTRDQWEAALDKAPSDWDLRLAYSDWLEEQGLPKQAEAQRYMAREKKQPRTLTGWPIWWHPYPDGVNQFRLDDDVVEALPNHFDIPSLRSVFHWGVPIERYRNKSRRGHAIRYYKTRQLAEAALAVALSRLKRSRK